MVIERNVTIYGCTWIPKGISWKLISIYLLPNHFLPLKVPYSPTNEEECKHAKVTGCWALTPLGSPLCRSHTFAGLSLLVIYLHWFFHWNLQREKMLPPLSSQDFLSNLTKTCSRYYHSIISGTRTWALSQGHSLETPAGGENPSGDQKHLLSSPNLCLVCMRLSFLVLRQYFSMLLKYSVTD